MFAFNRTKMTLLAVTLLGGQLIGCATDARVSSWNSPSDTAFEESADAPPTAKTLSLMARILAHQGKDPQATYVLQSILEKYQNFMPAYGELAQLHMRSGRVDQAIATLNSALKVSPNDPIVLNNLGLCYLVANDHENALTMFSAATAAQPHDARFRANMAVTLAMLGRYQESLENYQLVVLTPAEAHYNLAVLCEARGDYQQAISEYIRAGCLDEKMDVQGDIDRLEPILGRVPMMRRDG